MSDERVNEKRLSFSLFSPARVGLQSRRRQTHVEEKNVSSLKKIKLGNNRKYNERKVEKYVWNLL